jgi:hypothetical protein
MSNEMTEEEKKAFSEKVRSISFAASAMPSRSLAAEAKREEKQMTKDMGAYKRLRDDNIQPPSVRGSAELESHAETKMEVEAGTVVRNKRTREATEKLLAD